MSHAGRNATERTVGHGVGVGAEDQSARKGVAFFREDDVADPLTGVELRNALLFDPRARFHLGHRILLADRRIVMVEHHHHLRWVEHLVATHLAQQVGGARRPTIIEHDVVGHDVDDFPNLDTCAVGMAGNDLRNRMHRRFVL